VNGAAAVTKPDNENTLGLKTKFDILASVPLPITFAVQIDAFDKWPKYNGSWMLMV
jgi:hypothetical protein